MSDIHPQAEHVFGDALGAPPGERARFIDERCAGDVDLRADVMTLMRHYEATRGFLEPPRITLNTVDADVPPLSAFDSSGVVPERIGQYRVVKRIGAGGMGEVYLAEQDNPRREVALKVIRPGVASREALRRFTYEAQTLARLQHPGIAQVYEAGAIAAGDRQQPFFAMELVRGAALTDYLALRNPDTRQRLELFADICDAVQHAHERGVIHRDLKPANILITDEGKPKILDFGVARVTDGDVHATTLHTSAGQIIGTLPYMSPEQIAGDAALVDARSDVYALGVVLYEMLSGKLPHDVGTMKFHEAIRVVREDEPTRLSSYNRSYRGDIETIVLKALEKEKGRRYQSAAEFAADVRRYLAHEPIAARPPSTFYQLGKFARRNKTLVGGVVAAFIILIVGVVATTMQAVRATAAERDALHQAAEARRQSDIATAIADFLRNDILSMASPLTTPDRDLTVRAALDAASESIEHRDFGAPVVEAGIRATIALAYGSLGESALARKHYDAAAALWESIDPDHREGQYMRYKAEISDLNDGPDAARERLLAVLARLETALGPDDPYTLEARVAIASYADYLGLDHEVAHDMIRRSFDTQQKLLGESHPETLRTMGVLATALSSLSRHDESTALYRRVYEARRRVHGDDHPFTITAKFAVGSRLISGDELEESVAILNDAYNTAMRVVGEEAHLTQEIMRELAHKLRALNRHDEAIALLRRIVELRRQSHGEEHVATLNAINDLALGLADTGDLPNAEAELVRVATLYERAHGAEHSFTIIALSNLADVRRRLGRLDEAAETGRDAVERAERSLNESDSVLWRARDILAHIYVTQRNDADAAELMQRTLELKSGHLGPNAKHTRETLGYLAAAKSRLGRHDEAVADYRSLYERTAADVGENHVDAIIAIASLGAALNFAGRPDEAEPIFAQCAARVDEALPESSIFRYAILHRYGETLTALKRYDEALAVLKEAHRRAVAAEGDAGQRPRAIAGSIAALYDAWHDHEPDDARLAEAARWRGETSTP